MRLAFLIAAVVLWADEHSKVVYLSAEAHQYADNIGLVQEREQSRFPDAAYAMKLVLQPTAQVPDVALISSSKIQ